MRTLDSAKQSVLRSYGLGPEALFRSGVEAEVYVCTPGTLLKLYPGAGRLADLSALRDFYAGLERGALSYALPSILEVSAEEGYCISIEPRLPGEVLSALLPGLDRAQMEETLRIYLSAVLEVGRVPFPAHSERYLLFDPASLSLRRDGDFHQFLARFLAYKLAQVAPYLEKDVVGWNEKVRRMQAVLAQPYTGSLRLVHGDFYPGNLLVDETRRVTALLDFGFMTMLGDPLFDVATACAFFDMYDELKADLRARLLALAVERLGAQVEATLIRYLLLYSLLTANAYSECTDGHYRWCAANLNRADYWEKMQ